MGNDWALILLACLAAVLLIGVAAIAAYSSNLPSKWAVDASKGFLLNGSADAGKLANPYGLMVSEYGDKRIILWNSTTDEDLRSLSNDENFTSAARNKSRLVVYRSGTRAVLFAANFTLKEALTLSREKVVADQLLNVTPAGVFLLREEEIIGKSWLSLAAENWLFVVVAAAILYGSSVYFYALLAPRKRED